MDVVITKKKFAQKRLFLIAIVAAVPIVLAARYLWVLGQAEFSVDSATMVVGEVKRGDFTVSVRGTGLIVPDNIQWLSASGDARVERVIAKPGSVVEKGDLIVELTNPLLVQELAEATWEAEAIEAEAEASKVALELSMLEQQAVVLNAKLNYESSLLQYNAETELVHQDQGAVSKIIYERTRLTTDQYKQRWDISRQTFEKMRANLLAQTDALVARVNIAKKRLERTQRQVDDLQVVATLDSVVLEVPVEPGQRVAMGANIAKLAEQGSLIAELRVPEIQIRDVAVGQSVIIDTRNSKIRGRVSRVDPAVVNGNVQVDVEFTDALPPDARPDLSVDGEIFVAELNDTLYVARPLFAQSGTRSTLFKVSADGAFAERRTVQLGFGSIGQIQVVEGLEAGDKIIISDPTKFESYEKIRLN